MRVAYLVNHYPAVSHSFIRREIAALERLGIEVHRYALRGWEGALVDAADLQERERTRFVLRGGALPLLAGVFASLLSRPVRFFAALRLATAMARGSDRSLLYHWIYLAEACTLAGWLQAGAVVHLHAHFGTNSAEVAMLAALLAGIGYSVTVHGPDEFDRPAAIGLAEKFRRSDFMIGISAFTRSQLLRWVDRAQWDKAHVVHCGIDPAFHAVGAVPPVDAQRLVCVGRLSAQKGQLLLLDAMRRVFDRGGRFELVLAGDGELRPALEAQVSALGLQGHVVITGWVDGATVRRELLASRALVLPSFAEGLPVVIMEAMALRRPVISTFVAGIPELVRNGQDGWLVPAGDLDALVEAIESCLRAGPDLLQQMGDGARERALARHDVDVEAQKLARLFAARLGEAPPGAPGNA
jgi:colanic acid/amylovoran biosynthesis glycosyltransferase